MKKPVIDPDIARARSLPSEFYTGEEYFEASKVRYVTLVTDRSETGSGAGPYPVTVEKEDQKIVDSRQKGKRSRIYDRGGYSAKRETGTHHFHMLIAGSINDGETI